MIADPQSIQHQDYYRCQQIPSPQSIDTTSGITIDASRSLVYTTSGILQMIADPQSIQHQDYYRCQQIPSLYNIRITIDASRSLVIYNIRNTIDDSRSLVYTTSGLLQMIADPQSIEQIQQQDPQSSRYNIRITIDASRSLVNTTSGLLQMLADPQSIQHQDYYR